jgi:acid phosphatase type 7
VIVLNSYTQSTPGSPQYEWLHNELQFRFDRAMTPWLLVVFHCPLYTLFEGHVNERQSVRMKLFTEPLFVQYGVNVVVSGHDHAYMRTTPLEYDTAVVNNKPGPIYLILGAGGNREGHAREYRPNFHPAWEAASSNQDFGFARWFIPNATHAHYRWINNNKSDSAFSDSIWMTNLYI